MRISNCGHDENGNYRNGTAGDQSGTEWYVKDSAKSSWNSFYRANNASARALIAEYARKAADNDLIGYDQNERLTFWEHLKASDYDPAGITIACEADCSSGVAAIVKAVGIKLGLNDLAGVDVSMTTYNEHEQLTNHGFAFISCASGEQTVAGDIMLRNGHTAIVVEGDTSDSVGSNDDPVDLVGRTVTVCVDCLNVRQGPGLNYVTKCKFELTEDGQAHSNEVGQLMSGTRVTILETATEGERQWARIPSGWICTYNGKSYITV